MSSLTRYLKLVKPAIDEAYDIDVFNNNADKIDRAFEQVIATDSFISEDEEDPEELATMPEVMADGDSRPTLFNKISVVVKNVRYIIKLIGNTNISEIGDGTITDILSSLNTNLSDFEFRNNEGQAQYSMDNGENWSDFKHPVGTMSITANGIYDVTDYASADVNVPALANARLINTGTTDYTYGSGSTTFPATVGKYYLVHCQHSSNQEGSFSISGCTVICQTPKTTTNDASNRIGSGTCWIVKATNTTITVNGSYNSQAGYGELTFD